MNSFQIEGIDLFVPASYELVWWLTPLAWLLGVAVPAMLVYIIVKLNRLSKVVNNQAKISEENKATKQYVGQ